MNGADLAVRVTRFAIAAGVVGGCAHAVPASCSSSPSYTLTKQDSNLSPQDNARLLAAAKVAFAASQDSSGLRIHSIMKHQDGSLVTVVPSTNQLGGGGLVWVSNAGDARVLLLYQ